MRGPVSIGVGAAALMAVTAFACPSWAYVFNIGSLAAGCSSTARHGPWNAKALDLCTTALAREALNPHDRAATLVNRGAVYLMLKQWEPAHQDFQAALKLRSDMGEAHVGEGGYLLAQERFGDSEQEVTRGLELGTEEPEKAYYFRGMARWAREDFKGAYFDFKKALELKPSWSLPRQQLTHFSVTPATPSG